MADETEVDAAYSIALDSEFMRINQEIDRLIEECSKTSYGNGQRRILERLKERIKW